MNTIAWQPIHDTTTQFGDGSLHSRRHPMGVVYLVRDHALAFCRKTKRQLRSYDRSRSIEEIRYYDHFWIRRVEVRD